MNETLVVYGDSSIEFHCSYLESRGVPGEIVGNTGKKTREITSLSFPFPVHDFRWRLFRSCMPTRSLPVMQLPVTSQSTSQSASNNTWAVPIYYWRSCKGLAPTKHFISEQPHFGHNCFWGWGCNCLGLFFLWLWQCARSTRSPPFRQLCVGWQANVHGRQR